MQEVSRGLEVSLFLALECTPLPPLPPLSPAPAEGLAAQPLYLHFWTGAVCLNHLFAPQKIKGGTLTTVSNYLK